MSSDYFQKETLEIWSTKFFDRDVERQTKKRSSRMEKLHAVIDLLCNRKPLPRSHKEHWLTGKWKGYQECHIGGEGDWLLVYKRVAGKLILIRTGKHEDIFRGNGPALVRVAGRLSTVALARLAIAST